MKRMSFALLLSGVLTGCAKSVIAPYSVTLIDDRIYEVNVPNTYANVMRNYSVYRAAEQSKKLGCNYFFSIDNRSQSISMAGDERMDDSFRQSDGISYFISGSSMYKIIRPSGRSSMYSCTVSKPTGITPGLYYKSDLVLQGDIPKYEKPGFYIR